jgi:replication-associated recombination protein RarA
MTFVSRYRPQTLDRIAGQPVAVRFLSESVRRLEADSGSAAFVLHGPPGTGKTTAAWAIARQLGCDLEQLELGGVVEIASGQQDGRAVTELASTFRLRPMTGSGWRVAIVNEADAMTRQAEFVWLDVLENLPAKVVVVFTTNSIDNMSERFASRCQLVEFVATGQDSEQAVGSLVSSILAAEGVQPPPSTGVFGRVGGRVNYRLAVQQTYRYAITGELPMCAEPAAVSAAMTPAQKAWATRRARAAAALLR